MGRESSIAPDYKILAYITSDKKRVLSAGVLALYGETEEQLKTMTVDIAKAMKADVVQMTNGDYMVIKL